MTVFIFKEDICASLLAFQVPRLFHDLCDFDTAKLKVTRVLGIQPFLKFFILKYLFI